MTMAARKTSEPVTLPVISPSGDRWVDEQLRAARDAKGTQHHGVSTIRAMKLDQVARRVATVIAEKDRELEAVRAELDALLAAVGASDVKGVKAEDVATRLLEMTEEKAEADKRIEELEVDRGRADLGHALGELVLRAIGPEVYEENVDLYDIRRLAEDVTAGPSRTATREQLDLAMGRTSSKVKLLGRRR